MGSVLRTGEKTSKEVVTLEGAPGRVETLRDQDSILCLSDPFCMYTQHTTNKDRNLPFLSTLDQSLWSGQGDGRRCIWIRRSFPTLVVLDRGTGPVSLRFVVRPTKTHEARVVGGIITTTVTGPSRSLWCDSGPDSGP